MKERRGMLLRDEMNGVRFLDGKRTDRFFGSRMEFQCTNDFRRAAIRVSNDDDVRR